MKCISHLFLLMGLTTEKSSWCLLKWSKMSFEGPLNPYWVLCGVCVCAQFAIFVCLCQAFCSQYICLVTHRYHCLSASLTLFSFTFTQIKRNYKRRPFMSDVYLHSLVWVQFGIFVIKRNQPKCHLHQFSYTSISLHLFLLVIISAVLF